MPDCKPYAAPADPAAAGFMPPRLRRAEAVLEQGVADGAFPAAVALVARHGRIALHAAYGAAPAGIATIFDLASLTKVVACLPAILLLLEDGQLSLDEPVAHFVPEFAADDQTARASVSLRHLLTHTSGLPAWLPLYADCADPEAAIARVCRTPLAAPPGTRVVYSDLGFILLGEIVRRVSGQPLDRFTNERVFTSLGMADTGYLPDPARHERIAPTESGEDYETATAAAQGAAHPSRRHGGVIRGTVHDGNAYYAMQGVSGHAGLFATAMDLARYAHLWLTGGLYDGQRLFSIATLTLARRNATGTLNEARTLGWVAFDPDPLNRRARWLAAGGDPPLAPGGPASAGELLAPGAFGHTGFTGTSLWIDPARQLAIVLLTNRVHPDAANPGIRRVRPRFHNAVIAALNE
jgi:serine-type D-Ala-D-Ala carboxypeptidase